MSAVGKEVHVWPRLHGHSGHRKVVEEVVACLERLHAYESSLSVVVQRI